jgi:hypothetical protein
MLIDHKEDQNEKHSKIHGATNGLEITHGLRNLPTTFLELLLSSEVPSLFINIAKNLVCEHMSNILNCFLVKEKR